ncbi:Bud-site selection protein [Suillus fuscotomentosus]|uniref:Bud-site selection protein n=1 Tax=Suillus fuscotomentosus TaxID=1912939 RepID=A0AAD4EKE2_9AGAM|nr:Bud-site selection protein [Suillus fuscotomentosus]KAG1906603.1 Bud-site selection protein [Suillus fuscotomentosus]
MSPAEAPVRTTKRKREYQTDETNIGTKLEKKLHHDAREVRKAAKKAKTFEMQKILKKMKDARRKGDDNVVKDIEAQHMTLKQLDSGPIADSALSTKIKKDKFLSQDPSLQSAISKSLSSSIITSAIPGSTAGIVQSRLLSSKILAVEVSRIIEGLRRLLHPTERVYHAEVNGAEVSPPRKKKQKTRQNEGLPKVSPVDSPSEDEPRANLEDDGWESGTVSDGDHFVQGDSGVDEGPDEEYSSTSDSGDDLPVPHEPANRGKSKATQSTFLPSLSVGFIRGDSDTDFSDSEEKATDTAKKNRRGQRARRAIWEKKFGRHANHVMKQKTSTRPDAPSGTVVVRKDQRQHRNGNRDSDGAPFSGHKQNARIPDKNRYNASASLMAGNRKEEKPLHPSWEAKKKQQNIAIVPAQGTRIVFT